MTNLPDKLNLETARIRWSELARFFAGGRTVRVSAELDLIEVAAAMAEDDAHRVRTWLDAGTVTPVSDDQASVWHEEDAVVWAVVIKPWVLVQEAA